MRMRMMRKMATRSELQRRDLSMMRSIKVCCRDERPTLSNELSERRTEQSGG